MSVAMIPASRDMRTRLIEMPAMVSLRSLIRYQPSRLKDRAPGDKRGRTLWLPPPRLCRLASYGKQFDIQV